MRILRQALVSGSVGIVNILTNSLEIAEEVEESDLRALMDGHSSIEESELDSDSFDETWS